MKYDLVLRDGNYEIHEDGRVIWFIERMANMLNKEPEQEYNKRAMETFNELIGRKKKEKREKERMIIKSKIV